MGRFDARQFCTEEQKQFFKEIVIIFSEDYRRVSQVVFTENSGDTITILFQNVLYDKKISPAVWRTGF